MTQKYESNISSVSRDPFGFIFWLKWIFWFAASFIVAAGLWTWAVQSVFQKIQGTELTFLWAVSVFGSWFILVIPFMRKKERIWKRLNLDQEKALGAWLKAMGIFIGLLIASCFLWSAVFRDRILSPHKGFNAAWAKAVFGSWLFLLLPFLIVMYLKADQIFKQAVLRQTRTGPRFRTLFLEKTKRLLPDKAVRKLKDVPPLLQDGHMVRLILKDGRTVPNVFVLNGREIMGIYDRIESGFEVLDVMDLEPMSAEELPDYEESKWLRLDGRA